MAKSKKVLDKSYSSRPETHRICNVVPSRNTETDWAAEDAIAGGAAAAPLSAPPASVDLRGLNLQAALAPLDADETAHRVRLPARVLHDLG